VRSMLPVHPCPGLTSSLFSSEVHKARQISTGKLVALKRILMHNEKEGMPVTALREIKILKALDHPCIVNILDMFVVKSLFLSFLLAPPTRRCY
jgi:serine/threonine protein kinase